MKSIFFTSETRCHQTKAGDASECLARKKESVSGSRFFYNLHCLLHCTRKPERWILFQKEWIKIFFFYGGKYSYRPRTRPVKVCSCAESFGTSDWTFTWASFHTHLRKAAVRRKTGTHHNASSCVWVWLKRAKWRMIVCWREVDRTAIESAETQVANYQLDSGTDQETLVKLTTRMLL